ncbi:MAG: flagellar motor switch protein FliG [Nitrospinae bacterium]|nr:flagellar motor switch protein FliG [Nitrospinota bacterium]
MARGSSVLSGPEKAAVLLLSLGEELSAQVITRLSDLEMTTVGNYMSMLGNVATKQMDSVCKEFITSMQTGEGGMVVGGIDYVKKMLENVYDDKDKVQLFMQRLGSPDQDSGEYGGGLDTIRMLEPTTISNFLKGEHPQTVAIVLAHLNPGTAAEVIKMLPEHIRGNVSLRLATLERISPLVIKELDEALATEFRTTGAAEGSKVGGIENVAEVLNALDRATESSILAEIEGNNPDLAEEIRQLMFVFEDILKLSDRDLQAILKEIDQNKLVLALKTASEGLKEKIFRNVSERAALMMREDLEAMGPVKLSDVEGAQQEVIRLVKDLEEKGEITISGGGEELV